MTKRRFALALILGLLVAGVDLHGQTFTAQIQNFWNLLRTGGLSFSTIGIGGSAGGFPLLVTVNNPTFGAGTVVRFQNLDTSTTGQMGFDVMSGNVFFRLLVKNQNFNPAPQIFLAANSTGNNVDMALGAVNLPAWLIKAGVAQGAPLGNLFAATNNQFDIGDSAATGRPRTLYTATSVVTPLVSTNQISITNTLGSIANPTISSGFGATPSIPAKNGSFAFDVNVGTGGAATNGVINFNLTAGTGWSISCADVTTQSATVFQTRQIAFTTTTATIANFNTAGAQAAWVASDILSCQAFAF